jgi:Ca2+/Na+ antiporter
MSATSQPDLQTETSRTSLSKKSIWAGRIISGFITAFMIFDGVIHILRPAPVVEGFAKLHFPLRLAVPLAIVELVCLLLYVIPRTSILGAILLTGYYGGAVAIQLPTGNSLFGEILFPVYFGILLWAGIYLRDERLRSLIPFRR